MNADNKTDIFEHINNELTKAYIGGLIDGTGSLTVRIREDTDYAFGFGIQPEVSMNRRNPESISIVDDFCSRNGVFCKVSENDSGYRLTLNRVRDINRFLRLVEPYIYNQMEQVDILIDELLPRLEEGTHLESKEKFIETAEVVDELRSRKTKGRKPKYTADYFRDEWADELRNL